MTILFSTERVFLYHALKDYACCGGIWLNILL